MRTSLVLILLSYIFLVNCYPEGAPKCADDVPKHESNKAKSGKAPYVISATLAKGSSSGEQTVSVTITGTQKQTFKGFMIAARAPNTSTNIGKFTASAGTKVLQCSSSANTITHKDSKDKRSVTFKWTAPKGYKGKVEFRATVVKEFKEFYTNIRSAQLTIK